MKIIAQDSALVRDGAAGYDGRMDFEQVIGALLQRFEQEHIRYAVMGGFAIGALGIPRATRDLDFLIHRDDLARFQDILAGLGYQCHHQTEDVSQYYHPHAQWGAIDAIHAFRQHAVAMLDRAKTRTVFEGTKTLHVLEAEDIIGLKVQAMANNPIRRTREVVDIEALASQHGATLDWARILEYYTLFELDEEGRQLKERFTHAQ